MTATTTLPATVIKDRDEDTATPAGDGVRLRRSVGMMVMTVLAHGPELSPLADPRNQGA